MKIIPKVCLIIGLFIHLISGCNLNTTVNEVIEIAEKGNSELLAQQSFSLSAIKAVNVSTPNGSISLNGDAEDKATLEMYVRSADGERLSKEELQEILDQDYEITIEERGNVLYAQVITKNTSKGNTLSISFYIHTATNVNSNMTTSGGNIQLANLYGKQYFKTSGGSLKIENIEGYIQGATSGGDIHVNEVEGGVDLQTSGGTINLNKIDGSVLARTSGGNIKGNHLLGKVSVKTSGGNIELEELAAQLDATTSSGSISVDIATLTEDIDLVTSSGNVNLTLAQKKGANLNLRGSQVNKSNLDSFEGSDTKRVLKGIIYGGGVNINATTRGGDVNLAIK